MIGIVFLAGIFVIVSSAAAWVRIYRLLRYFQLEGYDGKRYLRWLSHQRVGLLYLALNLLGILVAFLYLSLPRGSEITDYTDTTGPLLLIYIFTMLALPMLPRERQAKQKFTATSRAVRLLIAAIVVDAAISIGIYLIAVVLLTLPSNDPYTKYLPPTQSLAPYFGLLLIGPMAIVIAPFMLPLANMLMFPVEEAFRRYYLSLARRHLDRSGATVIALTGSYGKTSTKHYLQHILSGRYRTLMTPKSYNTLLGISRVINEILANDASYDYFIVEAGAYIPGEIARICQLVRPQIGMVVTVGPMHLERFGSMENIVKAKYEIIESLPPTGLGVFNADDANVHNMGLRGYPEQRIFISQNDAPDARIAASSVTMKADGLHFTVRDNQTDEEIAMYSPLYGEHNVTNILMAIAVARYLKMSLPEIKLRVATLEPAEHRLVRRVLPDGTILIDDAYSANPSGTQTALSVLALQQQDRPDAKRVVMSSGMFELGPISDQENRKLGERMAQVATDVILIGQNVTKPVQEGLTQAHFPTDHMHVVDSLDEAVAIYRTLLKPGDALLMLTDLPDLYA